MKRTVSILVIIAMMLVSILAIMPITATESVPTGTPEGTAINNEMDLLKLLMAGDDTVGKWYYLTKDMSVSGLSDFKGNLDGNGYTLTVGSSLVGEMDGITIKNLTVVSEGSGPVFGALKNGAVLENVTVSMAEAGKVIDSMDSSTLKNVTVSVGAAGSSVFGSSITGSTLTDVNVTVTGTKQITASGDFGGLATTIKDSTLKNVSCEYAIKASGFKAFIGNVGGIAAIAGGITTFENVKYSGGIYINTWATKDHEVQEKSNVGGIVAETAEKSELVFRDCENVGNLLSTQSGLNVGGILGQVLNSAVTLADCKNSGDIMGMTDTSSTHMGIGGMIGWTTNRSALDKFVSLSGCENSGHIYDAPYEDVFNAFCEISAAEQNAANKDTEGYTAVTAEQYAEKYIKEFSDEYLQLEENVGKTAADAEKACKTQSMFKSSNQMYAGGMLGRTFAIPNLYINSCKNFGDVTIGNSGNWGGVGGIVGAFCTVGNWEGVPAADIHLVNCYNEGQISGNQPGGIIGGRFLQFTSTKSKVVVEYCVNNGEIVGRKGGAAGGIVCNFDEQGKDNSCNMTNITINNCANYGTIKGATIAGGIVSSILNDITASNKPNITNCYNAGAITTVAVMDSEGIITTADMIGGIVANTLIPSVVTNCINVGELTTESEGGVYPVINNDAFVTATDNVHLSGSGYKFSSEKTQAEIDALVANIIFTKAHNSFDIDQAIAKAESLYEIDYTAATWKSVVDALAAAKKAVENFKATQESVDAIENTLVSAINALSAKPADFTDLDQKVANGESYNRRDWSDLSFLALTNAIAAAKELKDTEGVLQSQVNSAAQAIIGAINSLEKRGEVITIETFTIDQFTVGTLYTDPPAPTGAGDTSNGGAAASTPTEPTDDGGCGSIIGGAAVVLLAAAAIGVGVSLKKKED